MFAFWDWVGGRYSLDSAIGLSLMIAIGPDAFEDMLDGFQLMDEHFRTAPLERNLPCSSACSASGTTTSTTPRPTPSCPTASTCPASPAYFQQLDMESNGKSVDRDGKPGRRGRPARSSGARRAPTASTPTTSSSTRARSSSRRTSSASPSRSPTSAGLGAHHDLLMANLFAQTAGARVRQDGRRGARRRACPPTVPPRAFAGDRPTNSILAEQLTPDGPRPARSPCTSTRSSCRAPSGASTPSTSGASSSARSSPRRSNPPSPAPARTLSALDSSTAALVSRYRELRDR